MKEGISLWTCRLQKVHKGILQKIYIHKFDNLDEIDEFLEGHKVPKLTQKETNNLNCSVSIKESNLWFKTLTQRKPSVQAAS